MFMAKATVFQDKFGCVKSSLNPLRPSSSTRKAWYDCHWMTLVIQVHQTSNGEGRLVTTPGRRCWLTPWKSSRLLGWGSRAVCVLLSTLVSSQTPPGNEGCGVSLQGLPQGGANRPEMLLELDT